MATKSVVHDHFDGIPENRTGTYKAKCKHCDGKTTSNLVTHLKVNYHVRLSNI